MDRHHLTKADTGTPPSLSTAVRNEQLVRDYFAAVWNDGDLEPFDTDVVSDDYVFHHQTNDTYSVDELRVAWAEWYKAFPDLSNEIEDVIATANKVVVRYRFSGTHKGEAVGVPPTESEVETAGIVIFRVEEEQLLEAWALDDMHGFLEQLGAIVAD
jgi:steroid delta-isomerase-like uncharacterized protein